MSFDPAVALLFPGQGAHNAAMLDGVLQHHSFSRRYELICATLGFDPLARIQEGDAELINTNAVSSLLTVLVSVIGFEQWSKINKAPVALAGYSIGQWTALYAAGAITFESLIEAVNQRAAFMDGCFAEHPGAMMAVIGVSPTVLEEFCTQLRAEGLDIVISNYNCYGQYSLAGALNAIETALSKVSELNPKKAIRVPTSGAWHSHLLDGAAARLRQYLQELPVSELRIPVIDNVTGEFLPTCGAALLDRLAMQVNHPVQWDAGLKTLIAFGCKQFIEVGYGNVLTKFGFFIDRLSVEHKTFHPAQALI